MRFLCVVIAVCGLVPATLYGQTSVPDSVSETAQQYGMLFQDSTSHGNMLILTEAAAESILSSSDQGSQLLGNRKYFNTLIEKAVGHRVMLLTVLFKNDSSSTGTLPFDRTTSMFFIERKGWKLVEMEFDRTVLGILEAAFFPMHIRVAPGQIIPCFIAFNRDHVGRILPDDVFGIATALRIVFIPALK